MRTTLRSVCALAIAVAVAGCSSGHDGDSGPTPSGDLRLSTKVDPRHPSNALLVTPLVRPVTAQQRATRGSDVTTVFQSRSNSSCQLEIDYDGRAEPQRLEPAVADADGYVKWTWTPVARGKAVAEVVCSGGQRGQSSVLVT